MLQSKSLAGDSSVMFSPPSIVKHSLLDESTSLHSLMSADNTPDPLKYDDLDIEAVISEKTKVQHRSIPTNPIPNPNYNYVFKEIPRENFENDQNFESNRNFENSARNFDNSRRNYENNDNQNFENTQYENSRQNFDNNDAANFESRHNYESNAQTFHVFKDITNIESPRSFSRLNADRLRTINNSNDLACENLIAPKDVLANALADHIYKVTNQKPSTSKIDEILTNKMAKDNNQWWNVERDTGQENIYPNDYYDYSNNNNM